MVASLLSRENSSLGLGHDIHKFMQIMNTYSKYKTANIKNAFVIQTWADILNLTWGQLRRQEKHAAIWLDHDKSASNAEILRIYLLRMQRYYGGKRPCEPRKLWTVFLSRITEQEEVPLDFEQWRAWYNLHTQITWTFTEEILRRKLVQAWYWSFSLRRLIIYLYDKFSFIQKIIWNSGSLRCNQ